MHRRTKDYLARGLEPPLDVSTLAAMGSYGKYPNVIARRIREKFAAQCVPEPTAIPIPMRIGQDNAIVATVQALVFFPHVIFAALYKHFRLDTSYRPVSVISL